jgi:aminoglycoside N3'-acetyltransferase
MVHTITSLIPALHHCGVRAGMSLAVHSSLRSLGQVDGGAATVVTALRHAVGPCGNLVMSAYPLSKPLPLDPWDHAHGVCAKVQLYDHSYRGPSGMGVIADFFRDQSDVVLGPEFHRVAAAGPNAPMLAAGDTYVPFLAADGWVLTIGVDITRVSCLHTAETGIDQPPPARGLPAAITERYPPDAWYVDWHDPLVVRGEDPWLQVQAAAIAADEIQQVSIGQTKCLFFRARPVVARYRRWLLGFNSAPD